MSNESRLLPENIASFDVPDYAGMFHRRDYSCTVCCKVIYTTYFIELNHLRELLFKVDRHNEVCQPQLLPTIRMIRV
jgi:hypothetical protein